MRNYTLSALTNFTDKNDESIKYIAGQEINVKEERALELLASSTPVVRFISRDEDDNSNKFGELNSQIATLTETIEQLTHKNGKLEAEKVKLSETVDALTLEKSSLEGQITTLTEEFKKTIKKEETKK